MPASSVTGTGFGAANNRKGSEHMTLGVDHLIGPRELIVGSGTLDSSGDLTISYPIIDEDYIIIASNPDGTAVGVQTETDATSSKVKIKGPPNKEVNFQVVKKGNAGGKKTTNDSTSAPAPPAPDPPVTIDIEGTGGASAGGETPDSLLEAQIALWKMEEANGTRTDSVGGVQLEELDSTTATPNTTGKIGSAVDFDTVNVAEGHGHPLIISGSADDFLKPEGNPFSLSFWVYPTAGTVRPILGFRPYTATNGGVGWFTTWNGSLNSFQFNYSSTLAASPGTSVANILTPSSSGTPNAWNLIVVTFDGTNIKLYLNNDSPVEDVIFNGGDFYSSTADFTVGGYTDRRDASYRFDGYIDELAWWDRPLASDEVARLWNSGNGIDLGLL